MYKYHCFKMRQECRDEYPVKKFALDNKDCNKEQTEKPQVCLENREGNGGFIRAENNTNLF